MTSPSPTATFRMFRTTSRSGRNASKKLSNVPSPSAPTRQAAEVRPAWARGHSDVLPARPGRPGRCRETQGFHQENARLPPHWRHSARRRTSPPCRATSKPNNREGNRSRSGGSNSRRSDSVRSSRGDGPSQTLRVRPARTGSAVSCRAETAARSPTRRRIRQTSARSTAGEQPPQSDPPTGQRATALR